MATVFMTAFYMFLVIFLTFFGEYRGPADPQYIREAPASMTVPLLILIVPSILVGLWGAPLLGNPFGQYLEREHFHLAAMNLPLAAVSTVLALAGIGLAYMMYLARSISAEAVAARFAGVYTTLLNRYWIDELYCWFMDKFIIAWAYGAAMFDRSVIDGIVNGVARVVGNIGDLVRGFQTGRIPSYALAVFAGVALIALWAVVLRNLV